MGHGTSTTLSALPADHQLAVLRHELANVLNGILGMAEVLAGSGLNAEQRQWLCAISSSGQQMQSLISSMLADTAFTVPGQLPSDTRIDGVQLLEQVLISNTPAALARGNRLFLVTPPNLARRWSADPCLLRQILENLVGNAIKFAANSVITIEAAPVTPGIDGRYSLCLRVCDSGPGFDPAMARRIFTAYAQWGEPQADRPDSRGLGLHICKELVKTMQGAITCANREAGGASFEVTLPDVLSAKTGRSAVSRSALLKRICCFLDLTDTLQRSVEGFLARLGVRCIESPESCPDRALCLAISEKETSTAGAIPGLVLTPQVAKGAPLPVKTIESPVLESRLGQVLLELALEWQRLALRSENPGSTPTRR